MPLTWKDIFHFVERMWELNQKQIAEYLVLHPSTISRAIKGTTGLSQYKNADLFSNLFDPANEKSPVYEKEEKHLLRELIDTVVEEGFEEAIKDLNTDDYRTFVIGMFQLVRDNELKSRSSHKKESSLSNPKLIVTSTQNNSPSEKMSEIFQQAFQDYYIGEFIESDPTFRLPDHLPDEVDCFVKVIKENIIMPFLEYKDADIYNKIGEFTIILCEYNGYLPCNMRLSNCGNNFYVPLYGEENMKWELAFIKETRDYRKRIVEKYREIVDNK